MYRIEDLTIKLIKITVIEIVIPESNVIISCIFLQRWKGVKYILISE